MGGGLSRTSPLYQSELMDLECTNPPGLSFSTPNLRSFLLFVFKRMNKMCVHIDTQTCWVIVGREDPTFWVFLVEHSMWMKGIRPRRKVFQMHHNVVTHFSADHWSQEAQPIRLGDFGGEALIWILPVHSLFIDTSNAIRLLLQILRGMSIAQKMREKTVSKSNLYCHKESHAVLINYQCSWNEIHIRAMQVLYRAFYLSMTPVYKLGWKISI